jgi:hypothetical protein
MICVSKKGKTRKNRAVSRRVIQAVLLFQPI